MRRFVTYILLSFILLLGGVSRLSAQELKVGVDFTTLFDNTEYATLDNMSSGTLFSARLTPKVGVVWSQHNELMFGVDMMQDFGHNSKFVSEVNVQLYYAYRAPRVKLFAGIFPRAEMCGLQSPLFFDRSYRYYHNRISGVLARYENHTFGNSYLEFAMDYTGICNFKSREAFSIMSSGHLPLSWFYMGYDMYMGHYAKDSNPATIDGVVDNLMITPHVGANFKVNTKVQPLRFDVRLSYVQSLQRDRVMEDVWVCPFGGELFTGVEWYGVTLSNRLYVGRGSLYTYYDRYGSDAYYGLPLYNAAGGIYDAIQLSYKQRFFSGTVGVEAGITLECDGTGWGTRQWLQVDVNLDYGISLKRKKDIE